MKKIIILCTLLLLSITPICAQELMSITGVSLVWSGSYVFPYEALITVYHEGQLVAETYSNQDNGVYLIGGLPPDNYVVAGYAEYQGWIYRGETWIHAASGIVTDVDLILTEDGQIPASHRAFLPFVCNNMPGRKDHELH